MHWGVFGDGIGVMWKQAPQGLPGTGSGAGVACLGDCGAGFTDGQVCRGRRKGGGCFWQREQHEESYGGGKSTGHSGNSVAGESGPTLRGRGPGWRGKPHEGPWCQAGESGLSSIGSRETEGCFQQVSTQPELFRKVTAEGRA